HWIYDLMAERSWVRFLNAKGFQVYLVNWGAPGFRDAHLSIDTYVNHWLAAAVQQVQRHSGQQQLSLVGYCMGGLLTLLYAGAQHNAVAANAGQIRNIVTIASPIDFHANRFYGAGMRWVKKAAALLPLESISVNPEKF